MRAKWFIDEAGRDPDLGRKAHLLRLALGCNILADFNEQMQRSPRRKRQPIHRRRAM
jgi:hypothetical protein